MAKKVEQVELAIANGKKRKNYNVDDIKDWTLDKISVIGNTAYFKADDVQYSMESKDFIEIFPQWV